MRESAAPAAAATLVGTKLTIDPDDVGPDDVGLLRYVRDRRACDLRGTGASEGVIDADPMIADLDHALEAEFARWWGRYLARLTNHEVALGAASVGAMRSARAAFLGLKSAGPITHRDLERTLDAYLDSRSGEAERRFTEVDFVLGGERVMPFRIAFGELLTISDPERVLDALRVGHWTGLYVHAGAEAEAHDVC